MNRLLIGMVLAWLAAAPCAVAGDTDRDMDCERAEDHEIVAWRERYLAIGKETYDWACAACHDEGGDGVPRKGDRDSWSERSPLWSAVLLEHAKQGYLEMPAKGGHPYLSDRAVQAAGEYMLNATFPELPID